jgi:ParB/RepB/Spo0J family partition protein
MSTTPKTSPQLLPIPIEKLHPSPLNPRRILEGDSSLDELGASLRAGQLQPLLVRPHPKHRGDFEIACGHRRLAAARLLKLPNLECRVLHLDDAEFIDLLMIEQLQHEDFTPLEEAEGFASLMKIGKLALPAVAEKVKKPIRYVTDILRLRGLTKKARELLTLGEITLEHAIVLSRLSDEEQDLAVKEGLFEPARFFGDEHPPERAVTPRELQVWIDRHIRFRVDVIAEDLFPDTVAAINASVAAKQKVVWITREHTIPPSAKDGERIYGPQAWKPADEKPCEHAQLAVVRLGPGRGETLQACLARKECQVHWRDEIRNAKARAAAESTGDATTIKAQQERNAVAQQKVEAERARWWKSTPALAMALAAKLRKANVGPKGLGRILLPDHSRPAPQVQRALKLFQQPKTIEDLVRLLVVQRTIGRVYNEWDAQRELPGLCKMMGVDAKAILDNVAPLESPKLEKPTKPSAPKKTAKRKGGSKR